MLLRNSLLLLCRVPLGVYKPAKNGRRTECYGRKYDHALPEPLLASYRPASSCLQVQQGETNSSQDATSLDRQSDQGHARNIGKVDFQNITRGPEPCPLVPPAPPSRTASAKQADAAPVRVRCRSTSPRQDCRSRRQPRSCVRVGRRGKSDSH